MSFSFSFICAADDPTLQAKKEGVQKTLTKDAYLRIEPVLKGLRPDEPMHETGLKFPVYPIRQGKKVIGLAALSDGWAGDLSGDSGGALCGLGAVTGHQQGSIQGDHVYGYVIDPGLFVLRYLVQTKADVISQSEYESLQKSKAPDIGWIFEPGGKGEKIFLKGIRIRGTKDLYFSEQDYKGVHRGPESSVKSITAELYTKKRYEDVAEELTKLPVGTEYFSIYQKLKPTIIANNGGVTFTFYMKGFLNYKGQYRFSKMTPKAFYSVWPFGYVEEDKEVPKLALLFKNGALLEAVPYTSRADLEARMN